MSLLMDALKRAERARQAEAERAKAAGEEDAPGQSRELTLDPMDDGSLDDAEVATVRASVPAPPVPVPGTDTEDSLEFTPPEVRREIESMPDPVFGDTGRIDVRDDPAPDNAMSLSLEYGDIPLDETGSTLPSMRAAQRSVQDYFDGTHSMSMSMEDMQEAIAAEQASQTDAEAGARTTTMDGDTTSRRTAQAVLDARALAPSHTGRNLALVVLMVLLVGGAGAGAFMFKDRIMAMVDGRPTVVVSRPPATTQPSVSERAAPAMATAPQSAPATLAAEERDALLRAAETARAEEQRLALAATAAAAASSAGAVDGGAEPVSAAGGSVAAAQDAATAPVAAPPAPQALPASPAAQASAARREADSRAAMPAGASSGRNPRAVMAPLSGIRISRGRRASRTHATLVQAYDAFQRGDDAAAMAAYQDVLAVEPRSRDALLGAAAVMMRSGSTEAAASYYAQVLRLNPRDPSAQAALIALQDDLDPASGESHVKGLLERAPDNANLHFTLGNLYAEQRRWPEAQQAYFEAYSLDSENPDHAFNLAVSLDQLSQARAASTYYRRAMELSEQHPAAFQSADVARRLASLGGS